MRVFLALTLHELLERARDRWVLVVSVLFAGLASGVSLYARAAEANAAALTGPSLVTLASLFVPLVALILGHDAIVGERQRNTLGLLLSLPINRWAVVAAKFLGRGMALAISVVVGLGAAIYTADDGGRETLIALIAPTLMLGISFLAIGVAISAITRRQIVAASLAIFVWFLLVFFYDVALLAALVATDGAVGQDTIAHLVFGNPAGLYRVEMMTQFAGPEMFEDMGMTVPLPGTGTRQLIWAAWILGPVALGGLALSLKRSLR